MFISDCGKLRQTFAQAAGQTTSTGQVSSFTLILTQTSNKTKISRVVGLIQVPYKTNTASFGLKSPLFTFWPIQTNDELSLTSTMLIFLQVFHNESNQ